MDHCKELYARWLAQPALDDAVRQELAGIADDDAAITDRFYRDLEFGTGGLPERKRLAQKGRHRPRQPP